jgi:hypothetical protein
MMTGVRYSLAPFIGIAVSVVTWMIVTSIHPIFSQLSPSGLVPVIVGGIVGGLSSAIVTPKNKVLVAFLVGLSLSVALLLVLFRHDVSRFRNPLVWYWPIWLIPSYVVGGFLGRRYWQTD